MTMRQVEIKMESIDNEGGDDASVGDSGLWAYGIIILSLPFFLHILMCLLCIIHLNDHISARKHLLPLYIWPMMNDFVIFEFGHN